MLENYNAEDYKDEITVMKRAVAELEKRLIP